MEVLNDFQTSVSKALSEIDENWKNYHGLTICGTHSPHNWEEQIKKIKGVRESGAPFLGVCFGHQLAAIEYARNVLGQEDATSEEFGEGTFVVVKRKEGLLVGLHDTVVETKYDGGLGIVSKESYWNNYELKEGFGDVWKKAPNFITVQYHPEYQSSKERPHKILVEFLQHARDYTRKSN